MDNLKSYNENYLDSLPKKAKVKSAVDDSYPFVVYALWAPNKQGYLAGMPRLYDNDNIVRDNEVKYKQIKLFITEELSQDYIDYLIRNYKRQEGDIETIKKLLIVKLTPADWQKPLIHYN